MKNITLENKWIVWIFFSFIFIYLILRAIYVNPYLDEILTLNDYIETDVVWNEELGKGSANNHLLNTYLCKFIYQFSGPNFFYLRIPNIIAFVLFFFSLKYIVKKIIERPFQVVVFISLNMIPWIFEYFGFIRGYALALACLFTSIVFLDLWIRSKKVFYYGVFLVFIWLSFFANLSFFYSLVIAFIYSFFHLVFFLKQFSKVQILTHFVQIFVFILFINPLINYIFRLKQAGALWWGNLEGLWECTGVSIAEITFFTDNDLIKYILIFFYFLICTLTIVRIIKKRLLNYLFTLESLFFLFLFGNIFIIEFLAYFLKVNYPRDRAAIQLVFFSLIAFAACIQYFRYFKFLIFLLIFFPISFFLNLNIYSSTYQKNHRLSPFIANYLSHNLKSTSSYSVGPLISQSMFFELRNNKQPRMFTVSNNLGFVQPNFLVIEDDNYRKSVPNFYKLVKKDEHTQTFLFKDQRIFKSKIKRDTTISNFNFSSEFLNIIDIPNVNEIVKSTYFQYRIKGEFYFTSTFTPINLVLTMGDSITSNRYYCDVNIDKVAKNKKSISFIWNSPVYKSLPENPKLLIYLWNVYRKKILIKNLQTTLYQCAIESKK